jgi:hypothetical protein
LAGVAVLFAFGAVRYAVVDGRGFNDPLSIHTTVESMAGKGFNRLKIKPHRPSES